MINRDLLFAKLSGVKLTGANKAVAICPCHDDHDPSLNITFHQDSIGFCCFVCGAKNKEVQSALGLSNEDIYATPYRHEDTDYTPHKTQHKKSPQPQPTAEKPKKDDRWKDMIPENIKAIYMYTDEKGNYIHAKARYEWFVIDPETGEAKRVKTFDQYAVDAHGNPVEEVNEKGYKVKKRLAGLRKVLYNLHGIQDTNIVVIPEGEKDVHALLALGFPATTTPDGAKPGADFGDFARQLKGKTCYLFPDNDDKSYPFFRDFGFYLRERGIKVYFFDWQRFDPHWQDADQNIKGDVTDYLRAIPDETEKKRPSSA